MIIFLSVGSYRETCQRRRIQNVRTGLSARSCPAKFRQTANMEESEAFLKLRQQLKDAEEERKRAAEYGLELLESQTDLHNQWEEQRNEMTSTIENLEQQNYTLRKEVNLKTRMLESLGSEHENCKQQHKLKLEEQEQIQRNYEHEVRELKNKWEHTKVELDESRLSEKQLKHKLDYHCELLANKSEELRMLSEPTHETMSSEMLDLQLQKNDLETAKNTMEQEIKELVYRQEQLERSVCNLTRQLQNVQTEKEDREKEVVSYSRVLETTREANQELQVQLDQALQAQDPRSKGNSLFSEVEDRRAEMERALISLKVQHQSLQKQHAFTRQQQHRLKVQVATLLQFKSSRTDPEQVERLHSMVAQKNSEYEKILIKVRQMERSQAQERETTSVAAHGGLSNGDVSYYVELLRMQNETLNKEIEKKKDELSLQRMKALAESQRVLELERKLFTNDRHYKLCQNENMKLKISLDELKMKYEPEEILKFCTQKRKIEILPVDIPSVAPGRDGVKLHETSNNLSENMDQDNVPGKCLGEKNIGTSDKFISGGLPGDLLIPLNKDQMKDEQPLKERKRVRIMDNESDVQSLNDSSRCENSKTPNSPRSITDSSILSMKSEEEETTVKKPEKKTRQRSYPVIHVSSKPTAVTQCPQQ